MGGGGGERGLGGGRVINEVSVISNWGGGREGREVIKGELTAQPRGEKGRGLQDTPIPKARGKGPPQTCSHLRGGGGREGERPGSN